jgi:hypothetical protein
MKKSYDFDHEIINLVEKNVGTPAILGITLHIFHNHDIKFCVAQATTVRKPN